MNFIDRLSIVFVHTLIGAFVCGCLIVSYTHHKYRLDHLDQPGFRSRHWSYSDFRDPEEVYYRPFRLGAVCGAAVGALWGFVACGKRRTF